MPASRSWSASLFATVMLVACRGSEPGADSGRDGSSATDDGTLPRTDAPTVVVPGPIVCAVGTGTPAAVQAPTLRSTLAASWDENWLASPALVDLDGDNVPDIVAARHSVLYAWKSNGTPLWHTAFGRSATNTPDHGDSRMWSSPVVGDFDGDGDNEIAVGSDADSTLGMNIALYDNRGVLLPGWPKDFGGAFEVRSIAAAEVDGDRPLEILVNKTGMGPATAVYELDGSMHANWPQVASSCNPAAPAEACWDFGGYNQNIGAGDFDGDGQADIVSSYDAIGFGIFHGDGRPFPTAASFTDRVVTAVEAYHDLALAQQGWGTGDRSEFTYSPPVIADIDGNTDLEVVLAGDHESSTSTVNQGITLWVLNPDASRPSGWTRPKDLGAPLMPGTLGQNIVQTQPSPAVGQLDGRPGMEIVVPGYDGAMHAYGSNGTELWKYTFATTSTPYKGASEALIADLNRDGAPEVIFTTYSSGAPRTPDMPAHLIILSSTGAELHRVVLFGRGSMAAPALGDLDRDGDLELVISLKDTLGGSMGGVQIWDIPGSATNCVQWATGRGGALRQGMIK